MEVAVARRCGPPLIGQRVVKSFFPANKRTNWIPVIIIIIIIVNNKLERLETMTMIIILFLSTINTNSINYKKKKKKTPDYIFAANYNS